MALSIKNREFEEVARELARVTGLSINEASLVGIKRELERQKAILRYTNRRNGNSDFVKDVQRRYAELPNRAPMTDDEILGYDEFGIPTK